MTSPTPYAALVIAPTVADDPHLQAVLNEIQNIRRVNDKSYLRWMPHILFFPFYGSFRCMEKDFSSYLSRQEPFELKFVEFRHFDHKASSTVYLAVDNTSSRMLKRIHQGLLDLYPQYRDNFEETPFTPHLTVGQWSHADAVTKCQQLNLKWRSMQSTNLPSLTSSSTSDSAASSSLFAQAQFIVNKVKYITRSYSSPFEVMSVLHLKGTTTVCTSGSEVSEVSEGSEVSEVSEVETMAVVKKVESSPAPNRVEVEKVNQQPQLSLEALHALKLKLLNTVCGSLVSQPKFDSPNSPGQYLYRLVQLIATKDAEFVLKLAMYVRHDLNVRSTANFLTAAASTLPACAPYLKKYFKHICRLPSDWLDIAALCQLLPSSSGDRDTYRRRPLPAALRKAMKFKFPEFDNYQLGKYNKANSSRKKKQKPQLDKNARQKKNQKQKLTIKQMIRQLHISSPVLHVMCILGKKYPSSLEEFAHSGLRGEFQPDRAGKRMRLPIPETWETMLSAKGNKASTWEELINHRKLPFMAMLRNLKNMILTGISPKHHNWVISRLKDERTVANSRQLPFRFFSAYEAVSLDLEQLKRDILVQQQSKGKKGSGVGANMKRKKVLIPAHMPTESLIRRYKDALDTAVKFSTLHNIKPIRGSTVVFACVSRRMRTPLTQTNIGGVRQLFDIGILMGLMCKYMCEECEFRVFSSPPKGGSVCHVKVDLPEGTILDNMKTVIKTATDISLLGTGFHFPFDYLEDLVRERKVVDNLIVFSDELLGPGHSEMEHVPVQGAKGGISGMLKKYRQEVNPDLLFMSVDLKGRGGVSYDTHEDLLEAVTSPSTTTKHANDIMISGFSDAILRYVAERGDAGQLDYIQHIDDAKGLDATNLNRNRQKKLKLAAETASSFWSWMDPEQECKHEGCGKKFKKSEIQKHVAQCDFRAVACSLAGCKQQVPLNQLDSHKANCMYQKLERAKTGKWRNARVFVSSTFLDMHGERDVLVNVVFPQLRERCRKRKVNLLEVDLRWGITSEESEDGSPLEICLDEVDRCRPFFIGLLGERYGWVLEDYNLPDETRYEWLKSYEKSRSITELEMMHAALLNPSGSPYAFFYLRNPKLLSEVPSEHMSSFMEVDEQKKFKLHALKSKIRETLPRNNWYEYEARYGGDTQGKPFTSSLQSFAARVTEDLWSSICAVFPESFTPLTPLQKEKEMHSSYMETRSRCFVGREDYMKALFAFADSTATSTAEVPPLVVHGHAGMGKSALLAAFIKKYAELRPGIFLLSHFVGAGCGAQDLRQLLHRLTCELALHCGSQEVISDEIMHLRLSFIRFIEQASACGPPVLLVIDSLNQLSSEHGAYKLDWLPSSSKVRIIVSTYTTHSTFKTLQHKLHSGSPSNTSSLPGGTSLFLTLGQLDAKSSASLVRSRLWEYRKKLEERPTNNQMRLLLKKKDAVNPLWLVLACEELRVFGQYEKVTQFIKEMAPTVPQLFTQVIERLEGDHSRKLVCSALTLLCCARRGIYESEMRILLARSDAEQELPQSVWSRLYSNLAPYLVPTGNSDEPVLTFFHDAMVTSIKQRYRSTFNQDFFKDAHCRLARYFKTVADPEGNYSWKTESVRAMTELPYHLCCGTMFKDLTVVLSSLAFLQKRLSLAPSSIFDLLLEYNRACNSLAAHESNSTLVKERAILQEFNRFLSVNAHIVVTHPELLYQQAANSPQSSNPATSAQQNVPAVWIKWVNKPAAYDACVLTLAGYKEPMSACAFSPDGTRMVCASTDRSLKVWDTSGTLLFTLVGHNNSVVDCCYSPDGRHIASASWDSTLRIWDAEVGAELAVLTGHRRRVNSCCFSHNGRYLLSASWDCSLNLWNANPTGEDSGKVVKSFKKHSKPVNACAFSHDDSKLVSASWDCSAIVWCVETGNVLVTLLGHLNSIRAVSFSPDDQSVVTTSVDCTVRVWNAITGKETLALTGHSKPVNACSFSEDGKQLISVSDDQTAKVWDFLGGLEKMTLDDSSGSWITSCDISSDSKLLLSSAADCSVSISHVSTGEVILNFPAHARTINACAFSPVNQNLFVTSSDDSHIKVWDRNQCMAISSPEPMKVLSAHLGPVTYCAFSPDGLKLATTSEDFSVIIWSLLQFTPLLTLRGHSSMSTCCKFSSNGKRLVTGSRDNTLKLWDTETGKMRATFSGHLDWVTSCCFSPNGKKIASGSWDFTVKIWATSTGNTLATLASHGAAVSRCMFSVDGERVFSASYDGTIKVWNVFSATLVTTLDGHTHRINDCVLSQSGKWIVSGSDDCSMRLWDADAGSELTTLQGHSSQVKACAIDGATGRVMTAADDCTVKVWESVSIVNGGELTSELRQKDSVTNISMAKSGMVASSSRDGTLLLLPPGKKRCHQASPVGLNCVAYSDSACAVIAGGDDFNVRTFDVSSVQEDEPVLCSTFAQHTNSVRDCCFAGGDELVVSVSWDRTARIHRTKTTSLIDTYDHPDWVNACAVETVNLFTACHDGIVRMFDLNAQTEIRKFTGHSNWVLDCSIYHSSLVTASYDGVIRIWDCRD